MTPGEFKEFVQTMKEHGVSHMKMGNVEISLGHLEMSRPLPPQTQENSEILPSEEDLIKHKMEQVSSLLKLDDHQLVDELFPDHTAQDDA